MAKGNASSKTAGERQKFHFQFITTPTADTPGTTLLLHFDNRRYIFGRIAEGTQRACIQRGVGIKKVRNLFLTGQTTWINMGGMTGLILTMADVQAEEIDEITRRRPKLNIHGGPKLMHSIACARRFIFRTGMPLDIHEADPNDVGQLDAPSYSDENINVWSIPVRKRKTSDGASPQLPNGRSQSPGTLGREQSLRQDTIRNMFDSDWRKDKLVEARFDEVKLPALVWVRDSETKQLNHFQCATMADAPHLQPDTKVLVRNPWPASLVDELPPADNLNDSIAISYIVRGLSQRGKFMPDKAKALGVKAGPDYAALTAGGSITLDDGKVITPDMVLGATEPGRGMVIFDIPEIQYLEDLSNNIEHLKTGAMEGVQIASWLLGEGVFQSAEFSQLVRTLPNMQHIVSSADIGANYLSLESASASSVRLAQIRPECFVVPLHDNEAPAVQSFLDETLYVSAQRGMKVQVFPKIGLNYDEVPASLDIESTKASYRDILKPLLPDNAPSDASKHAYDDVRILTLGTGSAVPSKYRNVSATLVQVPGLGSYLFDCGENTLGMLQRAYSPSELDEILTDLRMIWISHLHADHHLGTMSIINAKAKTMQRSGRIEPQLYVISEPNMADYLNDYNSIQSSTHCKLLGIYNSRISLKNGPEIGAEVAISQTTLPIKEFLTTRVSHCHGAQACSVTFDNGFKFSYSGDCRPSAQFAKIGQDSDVLLHEATFDDGLESHAMAKKHSTTAEALGVAQAMKAKNVVLTHFSQRYQKIPVLNNVGFGDILFEEGDDANEAGPIESSGPATEPANEKPGSVVSNGASAKPDDQDLDSMAKFQKVARDMNICVAFDLMSITVGQIRDMYKYYPAIEKMFELEQEKSDAKKQERREANERLREEKEKANQSKNSSKVSKSKSTTTATDTKSGDLYERINRNKSKGKGTDRVKDAAVVSAGANGLSAADPGRSEEATLPTTGQQAPS